MLKNSHFLYISSVLVDRTTGGAKALVYNSNFVAAAVPAAYSLVERR